MNRSFLLRLMNFWPPYFGAGIRVKHLAKDFSRIDVEMKLRFWNRNYVGTQFGGSLYSMTDPFIMLMLLQNLGRDYIVWDKAASIRFRRPGTGRVRVRFELTKEQVQWIKAQADREPKVEPVFQVNIVNDAGEIVAEVEKVLYVRRKEKKATAPTERSPY